MLKMLVADDDRLLRESISQLIDWKKHGIEVCALARSGDEVLSLLRKFCPDILLTDIEMPSPNGIALLRVVSEAKLPGKGIFLSADSIFSYAQDAVRYGAFGYLLKPVNEEHLIQTVTACREEILASNKERLALRQCERIQADSLENDLKALLLAEKSVQADLPGACLRLFGTQALCAAALLVRQSALDCPTPAPPAVPAASPVPASSMAPKAPEAVKAEPMERENTYETKSILRGDRLRKYFPDVSMTPREIEDSVYAALEERRQRQEKAKQAQAHKSDIFKIGVSR